MKTVSAAPSAVSPASGAAVVESHGRPPAHIGRIGLHEQSVREWAHDARGRYGESVLIRVFKRSVRAGGLVTPVWVAVVSFR